MTSTTAFQTKNVCVGRLKFSFVELRKTMMEKVEVNRLSRDFFTICHPSGFEILSLKSRQNMMEFEI